MCILAYRHHTYERRSVAKDDIDHNLSNVRRESVL